MKEESVKFSAEYIELKSWEIRVLLVSFFPFVVFVP